jgi:hypothetical protein
MGTRLERINAERNKLCPSNGDRFILWACAFLDIELADSLIPEDPSTEPAPSRANPSLSRARRRAIDLLEKAIKSVEKEFPAEERLRFAYERLAAAHRQQGEILRRSGDRTLTGPDETRGYIALRTGTFMAVVVAERYDKFELAKRIIKIVMGHLDVLGDPNANDNDKMSDRLRDKRQELRGLHFLPRMDPRSGRSASKRPQTS